MIRLGKERWSYIQADEKMLMKVVNFPDGGHMIKAQDLAINITEH